MDIEKRKRRILSIDSLGALLAGCITWLSAPVIQKFYGWMPEFTYYVALVNIGYGLYSGALRILLERYSRLSRLPVAFLVAGNLFWGVQCLFQTWRLLGEATYLGLGHLVLEGAYVSVLACFEARIFLLPETLTQVVTGRGSWTPRKRKEHADPPPRN